MNRRIRRIHADERGSALVESLVASALLGIALVGLVGSLSTFALAGRQATDQGVALALTRAQAARIQAAPYQAGGDYSAYSEPLPSGFTEALTVTWWDGVSAWSASPNANGLQKLTVTVSVAGTPVATLDFAKASR
jgi:Tfp pilus assembly protein PilV